MKPVIPLLLAVCLVTQAAVADYVDPPGWESNPFFTHQSWEFNTADNPLAPDSVANPVYNPYGTPSGEILPPLAGYTAQWFDNADGLLTGYERQGAWVFIASEEGTYGALEFEIPNIENDHLKKQLWFQATMWTNNVRGGDPEEIYAKVFDDQGVEHPYTSRELEFFGDDILGAQLVHVTYEFEIDPQPQFETLVLGGHLLPGEIIVLDEVDIDTRCVPEPSTFVMLLVLAATGLVLYRRRQ